MVNRLPIANDERSWSVRSLFFLFFIISGCATRLLRRRLVFHGVSFLLFGFFRGVLLLMRPLVDSVTVSAMAALLFIRRKRCT